MLSVVGSLDLSREFFSIRFTKEFEKFHPVNLCFRCFSAVFHCDYFNLIIRYFDFFFCFKVIELYTNHPAYCC